MADGRELKKGNGELFPAPGGGEKLDPTVVLIDHSRRHHKTFSFITCNYMCHDVWHPPARNS